MQEALVFDLKRDAINDGPGIRLTVFLKGCPLTCRWCHNPESISPKIQKLYTESKCIGCGECVKVCPTQACTITAAGIVTDPAACQLCGKCADICPSLASEMSGRIMTLKELLAEIEKERPLFDQSGGGVTFSGGEPLLYPEFLIAALDACGERNIHRAVDTSGLVKTELLLDVASRTDLFLYDLKMIDSERHKAYTGVGNELILANLTALVETGVAVEIRLPLIGGVNDDDANIEATAAFIAGLPGAVEGVSLLPYHNVAAGKHAKLGQEYDTAGMAEPTADAITRGTACFVARGLTVKVGG